MALHGIYGILPSGCSTAQLLALAEAALKGGVRILQYRDKKAGYRKGLKRARALRALTHAYGATLLINDSVQMAIEAEADGVHLGRDELTSIARIRSEPGAETLLIGVTCRADAMLARQVLNEGADYVSFGAIWPTKSKPEVPPIGLPRLAKARQMFPQATICAIGGVTLDRLPQVRMAGADCAAVISGLFAADDVEAMARRMVACWEQGR
ncbi:MAG: thiamine phosphate synthase [Zetaproteobacteria bacterium]|nr:MAG: thiamine phosphate synthase [Zetaproteobacteria bacterium]